MTTDTVTPPGAGILRLARRRLRPTINVAASVGLITVGTLRDPGLLAGLAVAAVIGVSCEALFPPPGAARAPRRPLRAYATDITHAIGNRYLVLPLVTAGVALVGPLTGYLLPTTVADAVSRLPAGAQLAAIVVLSDFANYWAHRALHERPLLWRFHAVHHSSERLDWLATSRSHPLDVAFTVLAVGLASALLGGIAIAPWVLTFFFLYPFVYHSNSRIDIPYIGFVFVTPKLHHWHHAADEEAWDRNFGVIFSIWDRLFGTLIERDVYPDRYGVKGSDLGQADYVGHLVGPFRSSPSAG